jgi:catechol 2,3-dioxygenase-like lactoylglutathione lyase family enzyme
VDVSTPLTSVGAITLFVADPQKSKLFYARAFEAPVVYEDANSVVFEFENLVINLLATREAPGLIAPAAVSDGSAGARSQFTIWVNDADAACERLSARGVELLNGPLDRPWGMRTAAFADLDGHVWEVAQHLSVPAA